MRGAYGETGIVVLPFGDPKPDIPDTLCLLFVAIVGRLGETGCWPLPLLNVWRLVAEFGLVKGAGGVVPPDEEFKVEEDFVARTDSDSLLPPVPVLESALPDVLPVFSVWNDDLERRRSSLRNEGAIIHLGIQSVVHPTKVNRRRIGG
jgi:hypothetical protein